MKKNRKVSYQNRIKFVSGSQDRINEGSLLTGNKVNPNQAVKDWLATVRFDYRSKKGGSVCALHDLSGFYIIRDTTLLIKIYF